MGWDGNGNVVRSNGTNTGGTTWQDDKDADIKIRADLHDTHDQDLADAIERCLNLDGENQMAANLRMNGFKLVNAGEGTAADEMATVGQAQKNIISVANASGTDALTASYSPAIPSLEDKIVLFVRAAAANTSTTPTFSPNGLAAKTIVKNGNEPLIAGDIYGQYHVLILQYHLSTDVWELLNPATFETRFPNVDATVTATEEELNKIDGLTVSTEQLNSSVKHNFSTTSAPTVNDDASAGYSVGSRWVDTNPGAEYVCTDNTNGAAVWEYVSAQRIANGDTGAPRIDGSGGNPVITSSNAFEGGVVDQSAIGSGQVGQGELKTTTDTQSHIQENDPGNTEIRNTAAGSYGIGFRTRYFNDDSNEPHDFGAVLGRNGGPWSSESLAASGDTGTQSFVTLYSSGVIGGSGTTYMEVRYVQSSPPYDIGDGECGLFLTVDIDKKGKIKGTSIAPDPIWANNGPTNIHPDYIDKETGKKYKRIKRPQLCREDLESGRCDLDELIAAKREAPVEDVEITCEYKNADMHLHPHSWVSPPQGTICMLDPVQTHDLLMLHEDGEDIADLLHKGFILPGDEVPRYGPPGVKMISFKWKRSK